MNSNNNLYELLDRLSSSEVSYVKKYSHKRKVKNENYLNLLSDVLKLLGKSSTNYESIDKVLKPKYNQKLSQGFSFAKNYVHKLVLNVLVDYQLSSSNNSICYKLITQCDLLISKGLYEQAHKVLLKAKKIADQHALHDKKSEVLSRLLHIAEMISTVKIEDQKQWINELKEVGGVINNINMHLCLLKEHRLLCMEHPILDSDEKIIAWDKMLEKDLFSKYDKAPNNKLSENILLNMQYVDSVNKGQWKSRLQIAQAIYKNEDYVQIPEFSEETIKLKTLSELIYAYYNNRNRNAVVETIEELEKFNVETYQGRLVKSELINRHKLAMSFPQGQYEYVWTAIDEYNKLDHNYGRSRSNNNRQDQCSMIAASLFVLGEYNDSLKWSEKMRTYQDKSVKSIYESLYYILVILNNYELGNYSFISYQIDNFTRYRRRAGNTLLQYETTIYQLMRQLIKSPPKDKKLVLLEEALVRIDDLRRLNKSVNLLGNRVSVSDWIKAKIEGDTVHNITMRYFNDYNKSHSSLKKLDLRINKK